MLTQVPSTVYVVVVGKRIFTEPAADDQIAATRCFLTAEAASLYRFDVEPFPGSAITVCEIPFADLFLDVRSRPEDMFLILSQCDDTGKIKDLEILLDPTEIFH